MTVYLLIALPAAGGIICWALQINPRTWFAGTGKRRFTKESAARLVEDKRTLEMQLTEARRPKPCPNCHHVTGWPTGAELADSDRSDPAPHITAPAPVDNGIRDTPLANAETQPVDVRDLREAIGEGDTVTLPVVAPVTPVAPLHDAPLPPVTWGRTKDTEAVSIEDVLHIPAPDPLHSATAVPKEIADLAKRKTAEALGAAS